MTQHSVSGGAAYLVQPGLAASAALRAADNLGVIACLEEGSADAPSVAERCQISQRGASTLLACLHVLGVVVHQADGTYAAADGAAQGMRLARIWHGLEDAVRDGAPVYRGDLVQSAGALYSKVVALASAATAGAARQAAELLAAPELRVLDLGAGAAQWSLALAEREPSVRVTAVDLPAVLDVTRSVVHDCRLDDQFTFVAGDLFEEPWPEDSKDLVIAGNLLHLFDAQKNVRLLRLAARALRPGGQIAVMDVLLDEDGHGPRSVVLYSLGLMLRTQTGGVFPLSAIRGWLEAAGFSEIESTALDAPVPMNLIAAIKASR